MTSGWRGAPYFKRYDRELVSKPAISLKKGWGGYSSTVERVKKCDPYGSPRHCTTTFSASTLVL